MVFSRRAFVASALSLAAFGATAQTKPGESLRIGAILALSGPAAVFGVPADRALRLPFDALGPQGIDGHPVTFTVDDSEGSTTKAAQLFRRLVDNDEVHIVLGPSTSGEAPVVVPLANLSAQDHLGLDKTSAIMTEAKGGRWLAVQR